ncbi:hypothetical protein YH66_05270 [[Brevibacterium] flavum]|uniref:Uncharacterized protein n=1 Tax=[Brevibacterium] flavum TaxID=92706 RepID=A0A0F6Z4Y6_9CORY|nr:MULTISPECIES: hypothetical protein [Corynebacterium]AKF27008.1 hypothetical protein YH66_05270 [[Brevibacterium] flavum]ANE07830.1 hypothetical protein A3654_05260 [Corynebacterium glutamicum]AST20246.1 hypothetical protein CEY17_05325 [Corynebacterium glutamicum ATCC 14067]KEI22721.1 hypothetical protein KIQ_009110 [Corynebacterium glutamicum ATCC 14067]KIH74263.1 hypothetical protein SD36_05295 [Corynebacterium glutamicum]
MDTIRHRRPNGGKTPTGTVIPDTSAIRTISRCAVAPTLVEGIAEVSRDGEILSWDVFTHSAEDIQRGDKVEIRGQWFDVTQTPFVWAPIRRQRARTGTRFTATRKEG